MVLPQSALLSRERLIKRIGFYGFIECGCILNFLYNVCEHNLDIAAYRFIHEKIKECLYNHYNGSSESYFKELKEIQTEIEYILSVYK